MSGRSDFSIRQVVGMWPYVLSAMSVIGLLYRAMSK
jgi:hypothetical protein